MLGIYKSINVINVDSYEAFDRILFCRLLWGLENLKIKDCVLKRIDHLRKVSINFKLSPRKLKLNIVL